jgi:hypothetical protein
MSDEPGGKPADAATGFVERRSVQRVRLMDRLRGTIGSARVYIADVSLQGVRVLHQEPIGKTGDVVNLVFTWESSGITLRCEIARSLLFRAESSTGRSLFHSGLRIVQASMSARSALRDLIATHVARALDEQKANARGLPAIAPLSFQTGHDSHYVRHELSLGRWRETATTDSAQPAHGFTVAASHSPHEIEMLRSAYERGTGADGRDLIRRLAQLSIGTKEGIPTRRFVP